ncbi:MAG TPA: hypothetical protein VL422_12185 [Miltoncostaea sp.]|nr:hypothetical protein [Miltoncostaea sp.]
MRAPVRRRAAIAAAVATLAAAGLATAGTAAAADPILPLSSVTPGMVGEARTVVRGTDIVTFPVTVLDVQRISDAPGGALILARAEGPLIESTGGVAEGMSGSPVYVTGADGVPRVIGAVAYGTGDQANVIIGITPIEQMIDSDAGQRANEHVAAAGPVRPVRLVHDRADARSAQRRNPGVRALYPLERWMIAGASRPLIGPLSAELARSGIQLTSIGPRTIRPPVPLVPGASLTALLSGGDLVLGAIGTVTYVDGPTVLGFGHPFTGAGPARFLMGDGYVYQTIAAPITGSSYKLAEPGTLQGMIVGDRTDGITGRLGPVEALTGTATAENVARGTTSTVHATIAPDDRTAPIIAALLQDEPALRANDGFARGTMSLRVEITSPALKRPFRYRNLYAAEGDVVSLASGAAARIASIMLQNGLKRVPISAITINERIESKVRAARILGARIAPRKVTAGGRAVLFMRIQPWRAAARTIRVPVRIPDTLFPGREAIRIVPNGSGGFDPMPADLTQQLGLGGGIPARQAAVRTADRFAVRAAGTPLQRVVRALRRVTDDRNDVIRLVGSGDDETDPTVGTRAEVPWVISGGRATARVIVR